MNPILRDYLYFTRSQRKALVILSVLIIIFLLFHQFAHLIFDQEVEFEVDYLEVKYKEIEKEVVAISSVSEDEAEGKSNKKLFPFDPNHASISDWEKLGLSEAQARSITKYREKGGRFRVRSDLRKMYVVSDEQYLAWESYIKLPDEIETKKTSASGESDFSLRKRRMLVDLNEADSAMLTKVNGIGPVYAARIVKFREALGGFYRIAQLSEVWGINDSIVEKLRPQLSLKNTQLTPLRINQIEASELKKHPYVSWKAANTIVNYRNQHGAFQDLEDLNKIYSLSDTLINKLSPYLEFD